MVLNKKGNVLDWFYIFAILMLTGVCIFVAFIIVDTTQTSGIFDDNPEAANALSISRSTILNFDNVMLFMIVGLSIFMIVSASMVFNHPAFFIISLFLLTVAVVVSAIVSNSWWDFSNSTYILTVAGYFPKIQFLFENLPFYVVFMGVATTIAMYASYTKQ